MHSLIHLTLASSMLASTIHAAYNIKDSFSGSTFFDGFQFITTNGDYGNQDPTDGFTWYVSKDKATQNGYITSADGQPTYIGVDYSTVTTDVNKTREAVRLQSNRRYTHGVFVLDIEHMPGAYCGTWPAWWLFGGNNGCDTCQADGTGEMDIIENCNAANFNGMTMYAYADACSIDDPTGQQYAALNGVNCGDNLAGCSSDDYRTQSWGTDFNSGGGGVYAYEWTSLGGKMWWWHRDSIPSGDSGPLQANPDPSTWGEPSGLFQGSGCNFDDNFHGMNLILNTAFCGDSGDATWSDPNFGNCQQSTGVATCDDFVRNNPSAFKDAYWSINSMSVYCQDGDTACINA